MKVYVLCIAYLMVFSTTYVPWAFDMWFDQFRFFLNYRSPVYMELIRWLI